MNDHRAIIVGVCEATRTFQSNPVVYTTLQPGQAVRPQERKILSFILVQTGRRRGRAARSPPEVVAERIQAQTGLGARTSEKFIVQDDQVLPELHGHPDQLRDHGLPRLPGRARRSPARRSTTSRSRTSSSSARSRRWGRRTCRIVGDDPAPGRRWSGVLGYGIGVGLSTPLRLEALGWQGQPTSWPSSRPGSCCPITGRGDRPDLRPGQPALASSG